MLTATDIFKAIKNKIWWILAILLLVTGVMYYFTGKMAKKYKSKAQFSTGITESSAISLNESKEVNQPFAIAQKFTNLVEMMKSRQTVSMVQYRLLMHELTDSVPFRHPEHLPEISPAFKKALLKRLAHKLDSCEVLTTTHKLDQDIYNLLKLFQYDQEDLLGRSLIKRVPDSDFIMVEVESASANLSAFVANAFVVEFIQFYDLQRSFQSAGSVNFFERMAHLKKIDLDGKVNELKRFKLKNRVINLYEQTKSIVNQLSSVEIMREQENMKIPAMEKAIRDIDEKFTAKEKRYYEAVSVKINAQIESLKNKINQLNERYLSSNMEDQSAKDSIAVLRKSMEQLIQQAADEAIINPNAVKMELISRKLNAELDKEMAMKTVVSIDKDIDRLQAIISTFAPMEASIGAIEREISVASEVYLLVLNKLNVAQFSALNDNNALKQAEIAQPAERPESSKKVMILALSIGLCLILTLMVVIGMAYFDQTFYNTTRFEAITGFSALSFLPVLKTGDLSFETLFSREDLSNEALFFASNVRKIRQELFSKTQPHQSILFTGTKSKEGKTSLILALAASCSLSGKKILLIDANFRNAQLTKLLGAPAYLSPDTSIKNVHEAIFQTAIAQVDCIGCAISAATPAELLGRLLDKADFEVLQAQYDYVFMEGPCLQQWSDSRELAHLATHVVTVFAAHHALSDNDQEAISFINGLAEKHLGAILNMVPLDEIVALKNKKRLFSFTKRSAS